VDHGALVRVGASSFVMLVAATSERGVVRGVMPLGKLVTEVVARER
jgi:hypothetical protein